MKLDQLHLRFRIFLFFAFIAISAVGFVIAGLWLGAQRDSEGFTLAGVIACIGIIGLVTWVWFLFDENLAKPMQALAGALMARAHTDMVEELDARTARYLGDLAPAAKDLAAHLSRARNALAETVAQETTRLIGEKERLVTIAEDVPYGLVLCSGQHKIAFYNGAAAQMLDEHHHPGLNHSLFDFLRDAPVLDAYNRLCVSGKGREAQVGTLVSTVQGGRTIHAHMRLLHAADEHDTAPGYVLSLRDATVDLLNFGKVGTLLSQVFNDLRPQSTALQTALDFRSQSKVLQDDKDLSKALIDASAQLVATLDQLSDTYRSGYESFWPLETISARQFVEAVQARVKGANVSIEGAVDLPLTAATLPLVALVSHLIRHITSDHDGRVPSVIVSQDGTGVMIAVGWSGDLLPFETLTSWLDEEVDFGVPGMTGRSVLRLHDTDCWPEFGRLGRSVLKLPVPAFGKRLDDEVRRTLAYDFDLLEKAPSANLVSANLADLTYVVFDTETTGLLPDQGDEICQIAAVRVVNGRVVPGEFIDQLVNPQRAIPSRATEVHHITDAMVQHAPTIGTVGKRLHSFARGAVMVAHNAPFDLEFLRRKQATIGEEFSHPVIDTVLLSAIVFGQDAEHTLDAICARLGIVIPPERRHTAMGDTVATAEAFIKMVAMCQSRGMSTFGELVTEARRHKRLIKDLNDALEV